MGTEEAQAHWLDDKVEGWRSLVDIMSRVARKHLQASYTVLNNYLQQECGFVQSVTLNTGTAFHTVEGVLQDTLLLAIFKGATYQISGIAVTSLLVKQDSIALPDPTQTAKSNWTAACVITGHLVAALHGTAEFWSGAHALFMGEVRYDIRRQHAEAAETSLGKSLAATFTEVSHSLFLK